MNKPFYRIIKSGKDLWTIIEPTRMLTLYDEDNKLLGFKTKEAALKYCEEKNYYVGEEYR